MDNWQSGDVEANGIRLHYTRTGGGKPPFVLAHGFTDDGLCWSSVARSLSPDYDVIMVDARGHGRSSFTDGGYDPATQADDLYGLIRALELEKPWVMGHSLGAIAVLALAGRYPDVPRAVLLEDPPSLWVSSPNDNPAQAKEGLRKWILPLTKKTREELIAGEHVNSPRWSEADLENWADSKLLFHAGVIDHLFSSGGVEFSWPETLKRIKCPLLVMTGDLPLGSILNSDGIAALQAHIPHMQVEHIPGAGHSIRRDQFTPYMKTVREFLQEIGG